MVNYWAIAIGINQYQSFQPLSCAQADAEAIQEFLVNSAGFSPQNSLLMTNTSVPIQDQSTFPTKENILRWIEQLTASSWQPQDYLWLFFSGYGVNYQDKDYFMPVDANPEQIAETGIEVRSLMQSLHISGIQTLFIFDINRAFGTQADAPVGQEIMAIAQELQQSAIISCQPEEFSHESTELGHGFFTAALLESLNSAKGYDFSELANYLTYLTPKLCQHHWRPLQHPVTFIPSPQPVILPIISLDPDSEIPVNIFPDESFAATATSAPLAVNSSVQTTLTPTIPDPDKYPDKPDSQNQSLATSPELTTSSRYIPKVSQKDTYSLENNVPIWQQFILWGGGSMVIVAVIATFLLRNPSLFRIFSTSPSNNTNSQVQVPQTSISNNPSNSNARQQAILTLEKMSLRPTEVRDLTMAITTAQKIQPEQPLYKQAQENIQVWNQMILELAEAKAQTGDYNNAIAAARLITKEQPLYSQAQTAIQKWDMATQQYLSNKTLLDAAKALITPGQASSYNRAIEVAKKIPKGQPGFEIAQTSINKWSETILDLAKARAAQGDFPSAIATASLVPEVTIAYEDAQDAIKKWQQQKRD